LSDLLDVLAKQRESIKKYLARLRIF